MVFFERRINDDTSSLSLIKTADLTWQPTDASGISAKKFESCAKQLDVREAGLLKFEAGATGLKLKLDYRLDLFVLKGVLRENETDRQAGMFLRFLPGGNVNLSSAAGCEVFYRARRGGKMPPAALAKDTTKKESWEPWGERGSQMVSFSKEAGERSWLGYSIPNLHVPDHDHPGGEEVFMVEGVMEDSACVLSAGTWARIPKGLRHAPVVGSSGCKMLVWEGDAHLN